MAKKKEEEIIVKNLNKEEKFSKEQILKSKKFADNRDLLMTILEDKKEYSFSDIDNLVKKFLEMEVK